MENKQIKSPGYKEFYKENGIHGGKGDFLSGKDVDPKELEMGVKVEREHTKDDTLAKEIAMDHLAEDPHYYTKLHGSGLADELKNEDGSMRIPRLRGVVGLAKIIQVGKPTTGGCADGAVSGLTNVGGSADKITAAGMVDKSVASKSVGGDVVSGEGQKQGGPNSSGKIDGTPKEIGGSDGQSGGPNSSGKIDGTPKLNESHVDLIKKMVREVLSEIEVDECHSYKQVSQTQARVQKDDHARNVQNDPKMT